MSVMEDIQQLEYQIKASEDLLARREMALKLEQNHEFRKLFIEGWFLTEAARLVQMSTDPRVDASIQSSCLEEARATGFARRYLSDSIQMGYKALTDLPQMRATLDELRAMADRGEDYESDED